MIPNWVIAAFFTLWALVIWGAVIYAFWKGWGSYVRSRRHPKDSVHARVSHKQGRHEIDAFTGQYEYTQKVLVFECEDGVTRDYEVHDDIWDWTEPGDDGVLIYQGERFLSFENRRPRYDMDKALDSLTRT